MKAVLILREASDLSWAESKRQLGEQSFINDLINFDKENMSDKTLKRISQVVSKPDFSPMIVGRVSGAAKSLCQWVRAMEVYGRIYRVVEPKRKVRHIEKEREREREWCMIFHCTCICLFFFLEIGRCSESVGSEASITG